MNSTEMGRVRSADLAARAALVELDGSEGTAVPARLGDGLHPHALAPGGECVLGVSEAGERTLLATLDHRPGDLPVLGASAASTAAPPTSFAYTDGATWRDALAVSVRSLAACDVWASGWLALRAPSATATPAWELRVAVDGASAGPAVGWGSALANLQQVSNLQARLPLPGPGLWTVRLQLRVRLSGATVACSAGLLLAETRLP